MEENAKGIMYVDVLLVLKVIIVKLVDDLHNVQRAQEHAEMGLVNLIIHVFVNLVGLESCAIKISHGLEIRSNFSLMVLFITNWINMKISYLMSYNLNSIYMMFIHKFKTFHFKPRI